MDADPAKLSPEAARETPPPEPGDGALQFAPLEWVRPLAILAVTATVVGRAVAPSLHGAVVGLDPVLDQIDRAGGVLSHLLLMANVAMLLAVTLAVLRLPRLPLAYRLVATGFAGIVLGLSAPASSARLSPEFSGLLALSAVVLAMMGTAQAVTAPHTRALGVMLGLTSLAALTRQAAWALALVGGEQASLRVALAGRGVASVALLLHALAIVVALIWLATRKRRVAGVGTTLAMVGAMAISWAAERVERGGVPGWKLALGRSAQRLISPPVPFAPLGVRAFVAVLALLLAMVAIGTRRETPAVVGTLALVLVAGTDVDIPLCALSMAVASLAVALTAHDPRSALWAQVGPSPS